MEAERRKEQVEELALEQVPFHQVKERVELALEQVPYRRVKERSDRERQRMEAERRKEQEEELALEQVTYCRVKERSERERQRMKAERRKEQEEELALEQVPYRRGNNQSMSSSSSSKWCELQWPPDRPPPALLWAFILHFEPFFANFFWLENVKDVLTSLWRFLIHNTACIFFYRHGEVWWGRHRPRPGPHRRHPRPLSPRPPPLLCNSNSSCSSSSHHRLPSCLSQHQVPVFLSVLPVLHIFIESQMQSWDPGFLLIAAHFYRGKL